MRILSLLGGLLAAVPALVEGAYDTSSYHHMVALDDDYVVHWTANHETETLQVLMKARTSGWVGFGLSPSGTMPGSDVITAWVNDDGTAFIQDRFAPSRTTPVVDAHQDVTLVNGEEVDGWTVIEFTRPFRSCDDDEEEDIALVTGTQRVVWAMGSADPADDDPAALLQHSNMGSRSINLLNELPNSANFVAESVDYESHDVLQNNVVIGTDQTSYWCTSHELPSDKPYHITAISPVLDGPWVHHVLVYECKFEFSDEHRDFSGECRDGNMPSALEECNGGSPIAAWAVGGDTYRMPDHVGITMGDGGARHVLMEIHIDNPTGRSGIVDSSGLRLWYTDELREQDAGIMAIGRAIDSILLPPDQDDIIVTGYCPQECTEAMPHDINVVATFLHSHLAGRGMWLDHVRDGQQLKRLGVDATYDFNFQYFQMLNEEAVIRRGDNIVLSTHYSTEGRGWVSGGLATEDEMSLAYILYYPRLDPTAELAGNCQTFGTLPLLLEDLVTTYLTKGYTTSSKVQALVQAQSTTEDVAELLDMLDLDFSIPEVRRIFDETVLKEDHYAGCPGFSLDQVVIPDVTSYYCVAHCGGEECLDVKGRLRSSTLDDDSDDDGGSGTADGASASVASVFAIAAAAVAAAAL